VKEANDLKDKGNALYKSKKFDEALSLYDQAIAKNPKELIFYSNKCAVYIE
jgi:stress-induced-phosphoprotein 1